MIKLSQSIPDVISTDENNIRDILISMKQCIEELSLKSQSRQMEIRSTAPTTNDLEEGELVAYVNGVTIRIYTKQNGSIRYWILT